MRNTRGCKRFLKFKFIFLSSLLLFLEPLSAQSNSTRPVIEIQSSEYNFGTVSEGTGVQHEFTINNKGNADLIIQRVIAGCGCTAAAVINQAIAAGSETKLNVTFDSKGMSGDQEKLIRVYSNDPENPISTVKLTGNVYLEVNAQPANVVFNDITRGQSEPLNKEVRIQANEKSNVTIGDIKSFSKYIRIENVQGGEKQKKFNVVLDPNLPLGDFRERIVVNLSGYSRANLNMPVYANVKGQLQVTPTAISFGIISGNEKIIRKVIVENKSDKNYILKSVESNSDAISTKIEEQKPGKVYAVIVSLDPKKINTDLRAELDFKAETLLDEKIIINAYGVLPPKL